MTVRETLAELRRAVEEARSVPMSASVMLHRAELTALLDRLGTDVDTELEGAERVVATKDEVVSGGRSEAEQLVAQARDERDRLGSESEVLRAAREQAARELGEAREQAAALRRGADDYVDAQLAHFEVTLQRTLETLRRGRERPAGESQLAALRVDDVDEIRLPGHLEG